MLFQYHKWINHNLSSVRQSGPGSFEKPMASWVGVPVGLHGQDTVTAKGKFDI